MNPAKQVATYIVYERELDECGEVCCREIDVGSLRLVRSSSVARADKDAVDEGRAGETPGECVLAPAAADDENAERHGRRGGRGRGGVWMDEG